VRLVTWQSAIRECPAKDCRRMAYPFAQDSGTWRLVCDSGHVTVVTNEEVALS